ncbi:MAG TPA: arginine--tRNA ligase [Candidatus Saccharimonadales bacterium]|nr:arginine--tRNA ligase [Candidatus Saccharimonadales bacterium]
MKQELESLITSVAKSVYGADIVVELTRPEEKFGDYSTNIALQMARQMGKNPREVADELATAVKEQLEDKVESVDVAGPGFINVRLRGSYLEENLQDMPDKRLAGKTAVAEYSDPNPFKVLHAGHLYTSVVGDAIANLLEQAGATVHRVNFGGDVGLHVGKTMWAIIQELGGEDPAGLQAINPAKRSEWMAGAYVRGTRAYEDDEAAKTAIVALNKRVYQLHDEDDHESPFAQIYWTCRQWSYDYFNDFYARIGTRFEKYYPESETAPIGLKTVREHTGSVYQESDGAVVFDGEKYGLHTRVFINSEGLPTYEAKDVGLLMLKQHDYQPDTSVIITGNEQEQYLAVVLKSVEQFAPELVKATTHLTHGIVKLQGGVKMSSRKGNFLRAVDVLDAAARANQAFTGQDSDDTVLGAVKYAFLKNRMGGDIIYDPEESVSLEGNSGPYLQYAHARARSILRKVEERPGGEGNSDFEQGERTLARKISEYPEVVNKAAMELMPHYICTYLYELAQTFNRFYEHNRVLGDARQDTRLMLVNRYADTLKNGLGLLGIAAPDKM